MPQMNTFANAAGPFPRCIWPGNLYPNRPSLDPYDQGIDFDDVYPPRRLQQGIREAAACGVPMVAKGTEFVDGKGGFTPLTAKQYAPHGMLSK